MSIPKRGCKAAGRSFEGLADSEQPLPPSWCPLADVQDADAVELLDTTSADLIMKMEQLRLQAESIQDYVGARYPQEHDPIKGNDGLLFALIESLGALLGEARAALGLDDMVVIWNLVKTTSEPQDSLSEETEEAKRHLCPACQARMDESDYCSKCDRTFGIM